MVKGGGGWQWAGGSGGRREGAGFSYQYSPVCMEIGKGGRGGGGGGLVVVGGREGAGFSHQCSPVCMELACMAMALEKVANICWGCRQAAGIPAHPHCILLTHPCLAKSSLTSVVWIYDTFENILRIKFELTRYLREILLVGI